MWGIQPRSERSLRPRLQVADSKSLNWAEKRYDLFWSVAQQSSPCRTRTYRFSREQSSQMVSHFELVLRVGFRVGEQL